MPGARGVQERAAAECVLERGAAHHRAASAPGARPRPRPPHGTAGRTPCPPSSDRVARGRRESRLAAAAQPAGDRGTRVGGLPAQPRAGAPGEPQRSQGRGGRAHAERRPQARGWRSRRRAGRTAPPGCRPASRVSPDDIVGPGLERRGGQDVQLTPREPAGDVATAGGRGDAAQQGDQRAARARAGRAVAWTTTSTVLGTDRKQREQSLAHAFEQLEGRARAVGVAPRRGGRRSSAETGLRPVAHGHRQRRRPGGRAARAAGRVRRRRGRGPSRSPRSPRGRALELVVGEHRRALEREVAGDLQPGAAAAVLVADADGHRARDPVGAQQHDVQRVARLPLRGASRRSRSSTRRTGTARRRRAGR